MKNKKNTFLTLLFLISLTTPQQIQITPEAEKLNAKIMKEHLNKKKFISNADHKKIINQFAVDPNSEEAQDLAELTRKNIEFLKEHYKGQNVEILPPKYQYFNKNKSGKVVPVTNVDQIKKAFKKKNEKDDEIVIKSLSNRSEEIGKGLLRESEEINKMSSPEYLRKKVENEKLELERQNQIDLESLRKKLGVEKDLTFDKSLGKFNLSSDLLKKNFNFKNMEEIKKNALLKPAKKVEYEFVPHMKDLNFGIENDKLNLPGIDQRILQSTLSQQNSEFFQDHKIKKGNIVDFKKISEKDYLKSISGNEQLQLIERENESAIERTNKIIEEEIRKAMEGDSYKPNNNIPSLITGSDDFNERLEKLRMKDKLDVENVIKEKKKKNYDFMKKNNLDNDLDIKKNDLDFKNDFDKDNFLEEDAKLQREMELLNENFERELELIEEKKKMRLELLKSGNLNKDNSDNFLQKEKEYQKNLLIEKMMNENREKKLIENNLKSEKLRFQELEIENLKNTLLNNNKKLEEEIKKSELYKKREKEILNWKLEMEEKKKKLEQQKRENKLREEQIKKLLMKKKNLDKNKNLKNENLELQINYQKQINNLRKKKIVMKNDLKITNNLLMNNNKKLSTEDMKNFMTKIQSKISEIRKINLEIKNFENLLSKINNENLFIKKNDNKISYKIDNEKLNDFKRNDFPENLLLKSNMEFGDDFLSDVYLEDYPDESVFDNNDVFNKALLMPQFGNN